MILKSLLFGALGLASVPNQVTAQYINHLQKYYNFLQSSNEPERRIFDTKALTRVDREEVDNVDVQPKPKWTFATTASNPDPDLQNRLTMVVTRLNPNLPITNAFQFDQAFEYFVKESQKLQSIDVRDIVHEAGFGYITCGRVIDNDGKSKGFLLKLNEKLSSTGSKFYPEVEVFESCGFHHNKLGFVAVGASPTNDPERFGRQAIFLSVKKNLKQRLCAFNVTGVFPEIDEDLGYLVDNKFNKIIKYGKTNKKLHAMVGVTTAFDPANRQCTEDKDVLVMIADEKCRPKKVKLQQYGEQAVASNERGFALTAFKEGKEKGLVITGSAALSTDCQQFKKWDDTLVFRVNEDLDKEWWWRYDNSPKNDGLDTPDFGTAILMNDQGFAVYGSDPAVRERPNILVAGESESPEFVSQVVAGSIRYSKDAFVMELKPENGSVLKNEIMGLQFDSENGVLHPGKLDMHLSQDGHAVVMGNALIPEQDDTDIPRPSKPYLLERYDAISNDVDQTRKCSVALQIEKQDVNLPQHEASFAKFKPTWKTFKTDANERKYKEEVICRKVDLPVEAPTDKPTPKPTFGIIVLDDDIIIAPDNDIFVIDKEVLGPGSF